MKQYLNVKLQEIEPQYRLRMLNDVHVHVTTLAYLSKLCYHDQLMSNLKPKPIFFFQKPLKVIADVTIDQLVTFGYVMGRLTLPTSIEKMSQKLVKFPSACLMYSIPEDQWS